MTKNELLEFMRKFNIGYSHEKDIPNGTLFVLDECPFCNGEHKKGAYIIHFAENGNVVAKCHHNSCSDASFSKLYEKLTGKKLHTKKNKGKKEKDDSVREVEIIDQLVEEGKLDIALDKYSNVVLRIDALDKNNKRTLSLSDDALKVYIQSTALDRYNVFLDKDSYEHALIYISILAEKNEKYVDVYNRIYNDGDKIVYELDASKNKCVVIDEKGISISDKEDIYFHHSQYFRSQIDPEFVEGSDYKNLSRMIKKHFNLASNDDVIMFSIYLVSCFLGTAINHPLLSISGQKGSGKSSFIRKFCDLVDPKYIELGSIPRNREDLSLKISESLVTDFDNMSYLNKNISDVLCRAVTGGVDTRRTLYMDNKQTIFDLKSIIVLDGVQVIIKEDDLLDRTIFFSLTRFKSEDLKTEEEIRNEFEKDKPVILGYCFAILYLAWQDDKPIDRSRIQRMADFYVWAVKIGRAMGYKEDTIIRILEKNRKEINYETICNDVTAQAVLNFMEYKEEVSMSATELHKVLESTAKEMRLDVKQFPNQPNTLSRKLNRIQSNLEEEGILFSSTRDSHGRKINLRNTKPKHEPITIGA